MTKAEWARAAYAKNPEKYRAKSSKWRNENKEKTKASLKKYKENNPKKDMFWSKKQQAKRHNIEFTIKFDDVIWPDLCPALGIPLVYVRGRGKIRQPYDDSPSFDRIDPTKGYILGNVQIISNRANRIKSDANPEEIMKIAKWMEK